MNKPRIGDLGVVEGQPKEFRHSLQMHKACVGDLVVEIKVHSNNFSLLIEREIGPDLFQSGYRITRLALWSLVAAAGLLSQFVWTCLRGLIPRLVRQRFLSGLLLTTAHNRQAVVSWQHLVNPKGLAMPRL